MSDKPSYSIAVVTQIKAVDRSCGITTDNSRPRGRVSPDGTTFSEYFGDMQIAYQQYDLLQESLVSGVQLTLNGIDEATYVNVSGADPVSGTYTPEDGEYLFAANDGSVSFYFRLATYQGNDVFVVRDGAVSYTHLTLPTKLEV